MTDLTRADLTPLEAWDVQTEIVKLPSGRVVELKRPDLVDLVSGKGDVPDVLADVVLGQMQSAGRKEFEINRETLPQIMQSLNVIARAVFVFPKLGDEAGCIPLSAIPFNDKAWVFAWALGAQYEPARSFPVEQNGNLAAVPAGEPVPSEAEPDSGHSEQRLA